MTESAINDVLRDMLWTTFMVSAPILTVALVVGVVVGLLQALTSVQEMTLTFVPKLAAIAVTFWITMGATGLLVVDFFERRVVTAIAGG